MLKKEVISEFDYVLFLPGGVDCEKELGEWGSAPA